MPPKRYFEQEEAASTSNGEVAKASSSNKDHDRTPRPNATLFVSRLPFSATTTDLQTLFSDIGPLRRAFVVTDPESKISKGVGYVTFAVPEDAQKALDELQGKKLDGKRAMSLAWADAKPTRAELASGVPPAKRPRVTATIKKEPGTAAASTHEPSSKDPDAVRTVLLSGLATCNPPADSKTLYKRARKIGDVDNVIYPISVGQGVQKDDVAHVVFRTPNHAATAVNKLHAHTFKGALLSAVLKKRADGAAKLSARMRPETKEKFDRMRNEVAKQSKDASVQMPALEGIPVAGISSESRLIIRNLPWDVTASDLRAVFLPFGPIYKIDVPQTVPKEKAGKGKQKEVVQEQIKQEVEAGVNVEEGGSVTINDGDDQDQETAVESLVDKAAPTAAPTKGRGFAFVWLVSKADAGRALEGVNRTAIRHGEAERVAAKAAKGSKGRQLARQKLKDVRDSAQAERVVAVDWALSKEDWKKKEEETDGEATDAEQADDSDASGSDKEDGSSGDGEDDDDEEGAQKPALPTPSEGTTLFVRNLPYEATEAELLALFRQFGAVRYARITMDRTTDPPRSKGTGFVCFWEREPAQEALEKARQVEEEAGLKATGANATPAKAAQNPFSMQTSVLTADPSAPLTASFNIRGRILNVIPAVEREKADSLTVAGQKARQKQDKRNTYLMREGVPLPNTPLNQELSSNPNEIDRRLASFSQRRAQLAANPSLYISKTRLSVRQLPLFCTDRTLKRLAIHAIKAFKSEALAGTRKNLDEDESNDRTFSDASKPPKKGERSTSVIQSKVVRALDRPDPITGVGRSKGFGFLEMRSFQEALRVIRWANANKDVQKLLIEWHMEELDDLKKKLEADIAAKGSDATSSKSKASSSSSTSEDLPARLKRVQSRLSGGSKSLDKLERGGLLFVEFSIENATIVKQRRDRAEQNRANAERRKDRVGGFEGEVDIQDGDLDEDSEEEEETGRGRKGGKPPRRPNWNQSTKGNGGKDSAPKDAKRVRGLREKASDKVTQESSQSSLGSKLGSMIGRKRKSRKAGKA